MLSVDTNVLLYAQNQDSPEHVAATAFLRECAGRDGFGFTRVWDPVSGGG